MATVTEWISGHMIERFYHERWWGLFQRKMESGRLYLSSGILSLGCSGDDQHALGNGLLIRLYGFLPEGIGHLLVWILAGMLVLDVTATIFALSGIGRSTQKWEAVDSWFTSISLRIGQWLYGHVDRRIHRAYPKTCRLRSRSGIRPYLQQAAACRSWCGCSLSGVCLAILQRRSSAGSLRACG